MIDCQICRFEQMVFKYIIICHILLRNRNRLFGNVIGILKGYNKLSFCGKKQMHLLYLPKYKALY